MTQNIPNHEIPLTPLQLDFIAKMGATVDGETNAKGIFYSINERLSIPTIYRKIAGIKQRENLPQKSPLPVSSFMKYVHFYEERFHAIIVS